MRGLDLTQHLRLADHRAFQRGRDSKGIAQGRLANRLVQARHDFGDIKISRFRQQLADPPTETLELLRVNHAPNVATIAGQNSHGLIETDIAAAHQQAKNVGVIALETIAQQIRRRLVIDADDQKYALSYPMS
jgi:hypothetical protein